MKYLVLICALFIAQPALACYVQPPQQYVPADELISRTNNIVLAKAVKAEFIPHPIYEYPRDEDGHITVTPGTEGTHKAINYTFDIIDVIKGSADQNVSVKGQRSRDNFLPSNLTFHQEEEFWKDNAGRLYNQPDCQIHPIFVLGGIYLLFLDEPYHRKSLEFIGDTDEHIIKDKWLAYVKQKGGE